MAVAKGRALLLQVWDGDAWRDFGGMQARTMRLEMPPIDLTTPGAPDTIVWGDAWGGPKNVRLVGTIRTVNQQSERLLHDALTRELSRVYMRVLLPPDPNDFGELWGRALTGHFAVARGEMTGDLDRTNDLEIELAGDNTLAEAVAV